MPAVVKRSLHPLDTQTSGILSSGVGRSSANLFTMNFFDRVFSVHLGLTVAKMMAVQRGMFFHVAYAVQIVLLIILGAARCGKSALVAVLTLLLIHSGQTRCHFDK